MELEITWGRATRVWWAYLWRNVVAVVAATILAGIIGGIVGFVFAMIGLPMEPYRSIVSVIGGVIGLAISLIPVKMILGKDFGAFRLVLVAKAES